MTGSKCEDCGERQKLYGMLPDRKPRWCAKCGKSHPGSVAVRFKPCEDCMHKQATWGLSGDRIKRWCEITP